MKKNMKCVMCESTSKYKCPGCDKRTCSLACVKNHKDKFDCSGLKPKIKTKLSLSTLKQDINIIRNIAKECDAAHRNFVVLGRYDNRKRTQYLQSELRDRDIFVKFLPKSVSKHTQNTTWFNKAERTIFWHIEWRFLYSPSDYISAHVPDNSEYESMGNLLAKALEKVSDRPEFVFRRRGSQEYSILWQSGKEEKFKVYSPIDYNVLLRDLVERLARPPYTIVEFPVVYFTNIGHLLEIRD